MQAEYVRRKKILFSRVGDEVIALNIDGGQCYGLNDTATAIWEMLDTPKSLSGICDVLETRFDVDPHECRTEVERLLVKMVEDELVSMSLIGATDDEYEAGGPA